MVLRSPRVVKGDICYFSPEEVRRVAEFMGDEDLIFMVLCLTGLRFGELAALRVKRYDSVRRRLTVAESVSEVRGKMVFTTPKTHQKRTVAVPKSIAHRLEAQMVGKTAEDFLFTSPKGQVVRLRNWRRRLFDPAMEHIKRDDVTPHDTRHTAATLAIASGANVKVVQNMLGHASAAMTLDIYAAFFADDLDIVANALDGIVGGTQVAQEDGKRGEMMGNDEKENG